MSVSETGYNTAEKSNGVLRLPARIDPKNPAVGDNVSKKHDIHVETFGDEEAYKRGERILAFYFHGGPGYGFRPPNVNSFDPDKYFVVCINQRGAYGSGSEGEMDEVSMEHLQQDSLDTLNHFTSGDYENATPDKKAVITGGSWGSTMAATFAVDNPDRVAGLELRGVWLGSEQEVNKAYLPDPASIVSPEDQAAFWRFLESHEEALQGKFGSEEA